MSEDVPEKVYKATLHGWYVDEDGMEVQVLRREDGKWMLSPIDGSDPTYLPLVEIAQTLRENGGKMGGSTHEVGDEQLRPLFEEDADA